MKIIGIAGHAECGKTTLSNFIKAALERRHYRVLMINYADFVKFIATKYYNWDGMKDEKGRALLQHIGTEQGRENVDENIWVDMVINVIKVAKHDYDIAIIADCRFPNEFDRWAEEGYDIMKIKIERDGYENHLTEEQRQHQSEIALDNYTEGVITIKNVKSLDDLEQLAEDFIDYYFENGFKN